MMHQRLESSRRLNGRPERNEIIEKDEIMGLIIDLETMSPEDLHSKYFKINRRRRR